MKERDRTDFDLLAYDMNSDAQPQLSVSLRVNNQKTFKAFCDDNFSILTELFMKTVANNVNDLI